MQVSPLSNTWKGQHYACSFTSWIPPIQRTIGMDWIRCIRPMGPSSGSVNSINGSLSHHFQQEYESPGLPFFLLESACCPAQGKRVGTDLRSSLRVYAKRPFVLKVPCCVRCAPGFPAYETVRTGFGTGRYNS